MIKYKPIIVFGGTAPVKSGYWYDLLMGMEKKENDNTKTK